MKFPAARAAGLEWILAVLPYDAAIRAAFVNDPPDLRRRARLVGAFGVLACIGGWSLAASHYFLFDIPGGRVLAPWLAGTMALISPLLLLRTRSVRACAHLVAGCWLVAVGWGMWLRGGLGSPPLMSQVAVPFIALVILDRRAGIAWSAVMLLEMAVYGALLLAGVELDDLMPVPYRLSSNVVAASLFGTLMLAMGVAMEWLREEAAGELALAVERKTKAEGEAGALRSERLAAVGQLVASLAHEINNPLSYLMGNLNYLSSELRDGEQRAAVIDALDGATRVKTIVKDLKTFSRDDDERLEPLELQPVVATSLRLVMGETRHRTEVRTEFGPCPWVKGTPTRIGQIVINLVLNAAQATCETGRPNLITVSLATTATGAALLRVRDTGVGIPPELLSRVTEPFFTTKPVGVGTGLGLSVCSNLAARMGGSLQLESEFGVGTTVSVTLPAAPLEAPVSQQETASVHVTGRPLRILVIDDEVAALRALQRSLRGHLVVTAPGGREALEVMGRDRAFDLVLCDVMMPGLNGVDVAEAMRMQAPELEGRLVLISAGATSERTRAFLTANRYPVLAKPLDVEALLKLVDTTPLRRAV